MIDYKRGLKAGVIAGLISKLISTFVILIILQINSFYFSVTSVVLMILETVLLYSILGVVYALLYNKLWGESGVKKALFFSFIVHLLIMLYNWGTLLLGFFNSRGADSGLAYAVIFSMILPAIVSVIISIAVFGILLGILWDKSGNNNMNLQQK